ncbi:MAG: MFS transporter [Planctomycetaceae bacterium]|jgi:MFS family permease|nr:MFS transporter [Planctomycetaceae bacterium]
MSSSIPETEKTNVPWYQLLTRYHWFVFIVCCLGWGFDTFDQQIFNLVRNPALADLMSLDATNARVVAMGGYATSLMLIGWAVGGILFGIMGDKIGRARVMIMTILVYAAFTGLGGMATNWWDFLIYRFLTGMGVGGQFAAGVTLLAETMPDRARAKSLGMLQIVAAFCNFSAAILTMFLTFLDQHFSIFGGFPVWRVMFFIGFLPALLAVVIMRRLEEPEKWKQAVASGGAKKAGSLSDLFGNPHWRYNIIIGMLLATCGVIGLWGIGFFSVDLTRTAFRNSKNMEVRNAGDVERVDLEFVRMLAGSPKEFLPIALDKKIMLQSFIDVQPKTNDPGAIFLAVLENQNSFDDLSKEKILATLDQQSPDGKRKNQTDEERRRRDKILSAAPMKTDTETFTNLADQISKRSREISSYVGVWGSITSLLFNLGAVFGTLAITIVAERFGRRPAFTLFFAASLVMTCVVFLLMDTPTEVLWMTPLLGFCALSLFGGYAIYFPELFPTHLRSTAVSFCYNIGRFIAATGPMGLGLLTSYVFYDAPEPIRYAGAAMSITFIFGIIITWLGPETKGKPLPE